MDQTDFTVAAVLSVLIPSFGWFFISSYQRARNGEWHTYGSATYKYRRFKNGAWEYKDMTPEQAEQHQLDNAW